MSFLVWYLGLGAIVAFLVWVTADMRGAHRHWTDRRDWKQICLLTILVYPLSVPIYLWAIFSKKEA